MKKLIILASLVAAFMAASAGSAQADAIGSESCGGSVHLGGWRYDVPTGSFDANLFWHCGDQTVFSWEWQHTTDGGNHWQDWPGPGYGHRSQANCNAPSTCYGFFEEPQQLCIVSGSYRMHYWWRGGDYSTVPHGAGVVCAGDAWNN